MNVRQVREFCIALPGASSTPYPEPYNILVYSVGGRTFAYFKTSAPERWRFSTRVSPERFIELTDIPGVKPARFRGRFHWITIVEVHRFPASYLTELVDASYRRAFASLSRAKQVAIRASAPNGAARVSGSAFASSEDHPSRSSEVARKWEKPVR